MNKLIVFLMAAVCASGVWADVSVVREWQPEPGRAGEMYAAAVEAQAIHQKLGARVWIGTDQNGNMNYALSFADWPAWAKFNAAMQTSKEWAAWVAKYTSTTPAAKSTGVLFLNQPLVAKTTSVTVVYGWKINPGRFDDFMKLAQEAAAIQSKLGASPGINVDEISQVWYETAFDSWAAWAAYADALAKSQEWADFMKKAGADPTAQLMRVIRLTEYKPSM